MPETTAQQPPPETATELAHPPQSAAGAPLSIRDLEEAVVERAVNDFLGSTTEGAQTAAGPAGSVAPPDSAGLAPIVDAAGRVHDPATGRFLPQAEKPDQTTEAAHSATSAQPDKAGGGPEEDAKEGSRAEGGQGERAAKPPLAIEFKVVAPDGTEVEAHEAVAKLGHIVIETPSGEERPYPLDRVVRLARAGFVNEERHRAATEAIEQHQKLLQMLAERDAAIERQNEAFRTVLDSLGDLELAEGHPATQIVEKWKRFNSPEARIARLEAERNQLKQALEGQSQEATAASFFQNDVVAPLEALVTKFPTLTPAEVQSELLSRLAEFGPRIQAKDYDAVRRIVQKELPAWAAGLHETRTEAETRLRQSREEAMILKQRLARSAQPALRAATTEEAKKPPGPPRTMDERIADVVERSIAAM